MDRYSLITNIHKRDFSQKKILLIGAGKMAFQYATTLKKMNIKNVYVISKTFSKTCKFCKEFKFQPIDNLENFLENNKIHLIIVTPSIDVTIKILKQCLSRNQKNILLEKPVSLYKNEIKRLIPKTKHKRVIIGYNRLTYPNYIKLKQLIDNDGGITSCKFSLTARIEKINFSNGIKDFHKRWGTYNGIHVISLVYDLIGKPKTILGHNSGSFDWHKSGSIFVGSGISEKNIPFSYHADWNSAGRWGVEIMTKNNAYRLISLEELFVCKKNTDVWKKINFKKSYPKLKQGLAEQIAIMLDKKLEKDFELIDLKRGFEILQFGNKIFNYN